LNPYLIIGIAAAAFASGFTVQGWRKDAVISEMQTAQSLAIATATTQVMEESNRLQRKKDDVVKQAKIKADENAAAASDARAELERLHNYTNSNSASIATASCTSVRDYSTTVNTVFGECTVALEEMARKADGHALDANTLIKAWPTNKESK